MRTVALWAPEQVSCHLGPAVCPRNLSEAPPGATPFAVWPCRWQSKPKEAAPKAAVPKAAGGDSKGKADHLHLHSHIPAPKAAAPKAAAPKASAPISAAAVPKAHEAKDGKSAPGSLKAASGQSSSAGAKDARAIPMRRDR